jgi:hypothetical protein
LYNISGHKDGKMKKNLLLLFLFIILLQGSSMAEEFLGAPVPPDAITIQKTDTRLEFKSMMTHEEVLGFYRDVLKEFQDIKFREWKDATYIEDDGKLKWHSITISKEDGKETTVSIIKDNWTWIIGTLILRYIGVFVVLLVLFLAMSLSGAIISRTIGKAHENKQPA